MLCHYGGCLLMLPGERQGTQEKHHILWIFAENSAQAFHIEISVQVVAQWSSFLGHTEYCAISTRGPVQVHSCH